MSPEQNNNNRKIRQTSNSSEIIKIGGVPIEWKSKKQETKCRHTVEGELTLVNGANNCNSGTN